MNAWDILTYEDPIHPLVELANRNNHKYKPSKNSERESELLKENIGYLDEIIRLNKEMLELNSVKVIDSYKFRVNLLREKVKNNVDIIYEMYLES
jgi:hypothetical protein